jgi:hypothetical protein
MNNGTLPFNTEVVINNSSHAISLVVLKTDLAALLQSKINLRLFDVNGTEREIFDDATTIGQIHHISSLGFSKSFNIYPDGKIGVTLPFSDGDLNLIGREELKVKLLPGASEKTFAVEMQTEQMPFKTRNGLYAYTIANVPSSVRNHREVVTSSDAMHIEDKTIIKSITYNFKNGHVIKYELPELIRLTSILKTNDRSATGYKDYATDSGLYLPLVGVDSLDIENESTEGQKMLKFQKKRS